MAYKIIKSEKTIEGVKCVFERPKLLDSNFSEKINRFTDEFADSFEKSISDVWSERECRRIFFRVSCREYMNFFSLHFSVDIEKYNDESVCFYRSFVFDIKTGLIVKLSDVAEKAFAAEHKRWSFYIGDNKIVAYRPNGDGTVAETAVGKLSSHE